MTCRRMAAPARRISAFTCPISPRMKAMIDESLRCHRFSWLLPVWIARSPRTPAKPAAADAGDRAARALRNPGGRPDSERVYKYSLRTIPWNQDISGLPVQADSARIIASIGAEKHLGYNLDMNFVIVPPNQTRVPVKILLYPADPIPDRFPCPKTRRSKTGRSRRMRTPAPWHVPANARRYSAPRLRRPASSDRRSRQRKAL